jgi:hypothetical protein
MITAIYGKHAVRIEDASDNEALVSTINGENIGQSYIGGEGYCGIPWAWVSANKLSDVRHWTDDEWEAAIDWAELMSFQPEPVNQEDERPYPSKIQDVL